EEALIIDNTSATISSQTVNNPTVEVDVTNTIGNTISGDFSLWGTSKYFPATVEYVDGTYENILITNFTSTEAVSSNDFKQEVVKISCVHDVNLGQHLTNLAYKEMGSRLYRSNLRHSYKHTL